MIGRTSPVLAWCVAALTWLASPSKINAEVAPSCKCADLFDALAAKVEANYPGYHLEVKGKPRAESYQQHRAEMRRRAADSALGIRCLAVLQTFVAWFEEGHLFVGGRPQVTAQDSARLRAEALRTDWTERDVLRYLDEQGAALDPAEGIWRDPAGLKVALVRRDMKAMPPVGTKARRFFAFVLHSTAAGWEPGDVKAELEALPDGSYDVVAYDDVRAPTRPHVYKRGQAGGGSLQRDGLLLHMPPITWGKLYPIGAGQEGLIDPVDPRAPTARLIGDRTVVFHVPSHIPSHAARLGLLVEQYRGALSRAATLIIDLRGNEGGSAFVTNVLMPFLLTPEKRPPRYLAAGSPAVIASADNVAHFERTSWAPKTLVDRLRTAAPGTLVAFDDPQSDAATSEPPAPANDVATPHPRNVALLTDAMTVSAAEAFVLKAMRNRKVTLFGQATGSSIDYQNVRIVRFGCPEAGLYLGYPTIIGSDRLPHGGVRPTGIVPDVEIDPGDPDPIRRIIEHYSQ